MIDTGLLRKMKEALQGMRGRLQILNRQAELALERLDEAERQRDEVKAACEALDAAILHLEADGKQKPAPERTDADSRNSSHSMAGELGGNVPPPATNVKKGRTRKQK